MTPTFHAYMLRCSDGSLYVGHTDNLEVRLAQHQSGALEGYTATRRPVQVVWMQAFTTRDDAFQGRRIAVAIADLHPCGGIDDGGGLSCPRAQSMP